MVHGDDFVSVGDIKDVVWLKGKVEQRFEVKTTLVGAQEDHEARILNRVLRYTDHGWEYEADQ